MEVLKKIIRLSLIAVFFLAAAAVGNITMAFFSYDVDELKKENPGKSAFMHYREYDWEVKKLKEKKVVQSWVPLAKISPAAVKAVLIAGSGRFHDREDVDLESVQKALEQDVKTGRSKQSVRAISRQIARTFFLSPVKSIFRTVKERILAWRIENAFSRRRILELYLNLAEWGDGIFGIEAASRHYYNKSASELTSQEAARLAVVLPDPLRYKPTDASPYVEKRAGIVYDILEKRGIVVEAYEEIMKAPADGPTLSSEISRPSQ